MAPSNNLITKAESLAKQSMANQLSLGQALLFLQQETEREAKTLIYQEKGKVAPGSWVAYFVELRAQVNKIFWKARNK